MEWRPAAYGDLFSIDLQPVQKQDDMRHLIRDGEDVASLLQTYARSLVSEGRVIGVVGIWPVYPGLGTAWALLSEDALRVPKELHAGVSRLLMEAFGMLGFQRIQATVVASFDRGIEWLERLGFEREGTMRRYGVDGSDHHLYARVHHG